LSSTLLPGNSEVIFTSLLFVYPEFWLGLLIAVTVGNTMGSYISWGMGWALANRFPVRFGGLRSRENAVRAIQRWGSPILLLSWMPVIGDLLCVAAGWLKTRPVSGLLYIATGKLLRYGLIVWLTV